MAVEAANGRLGASHGPMTGEGALPKSLDSKREAVDFELVESGIDEDHLGKRMRALVRKNMRR